MFHVWLWTATVWMLFIISAVNSFLSTLCEVIKINVAAQVDIKSYCDSDRLCVLTTAVAQRCSTPDKHQFLNKTTSWI